MYQLPPIHKRTVFDDLKNDVFNLYHPWHLFTMIELVDIMRQKMINHLLNFLIDSVQQVKLKKISSAFSLEQ